MSNMKEKNIHAIEFLWRLEEILYKGIGNNNTKLDIDLTSLVIEEHSNLLKIRGKTILERALHKGAIVRTYKLNK